MSVTRILLVIALAGGLGLARQVRGQPAATIFADDFDRPALESGWTIDASQGNTITLRDGCVEIHAGENTFAHIQRPLGADHIRASCSLLPGSGISWCTSLFLYWRPGDWCQIGVIPRGDGRYYACVTTNGQRAEHDLRRCGFDQWHHVALELGHDCIRFLTSRDGTTWDTELFVPRPPALVGPPTLLVLGKGFGLDAGQPDLDGDYGERGAFATSKLDRVRVVPTAPERLRITAEEIQARELADCDPLGAEILSRPGDPDYHTVAAKLPPLARPREAVGVKDHPFEIGVEYDGTIQLPLQGDGWEQNGPTAYFEVGSPPVRFGTGGCRKRLLGGHLPIVICEWEHDGLRLEETVFGWSEGMRPDADLWALAALQVTNPGPSERTIAVSLRLEPATPGQGQASVDPQAGGAAPAGPPVCQELSLRAGEAAGVYVEVPSPPGLGRARRLCEVEFTVRQVEAMAAWMNLLDAGMQIEVPEPRINDACRAWLAYNYLNVDRIDQRYEPHDGSGFYEQIYGYSAALYCHALDLWGRHDDARRYLESLLTLVRPDGLFFQHYGLPDQGALLLALSEHYRLTGDADWLRSVASTMTRMCDWLLDRRRESVQLVEGSRPVTYGLIRFTPYADYPAQTCNYYANAYSCVGLEHTAAVLREIGLTEEAARLSAEAAAYRSEILASMDAAVIERDGLRLLPMEPDTRRLLESTQYKGGGYYGLIASMFLESEFLPPDDPRFRLVRDTLERRGGLILGMCEFDAGVDHAYTYGYWLNCLRAADAKSGRDNRDDDIRRVLLGFYGTLACGMGRETYCGVEVTQIVTGEPTPTTPHLYSGTQQLRLLRMMLLHEDGDGLVIGPAIPRPWLAAGRRIAVRNAPTAFGPVSFVIQSLGEQEQGIRAPSDREATGLMSQATGPSTEPDPSRTEVRIEPPTRRPPAAIRVRLRHPSASPIARVLVDGQPTEQFAGDEIRFVPGKEPVCIAVSY